MLGVLCARPRSWLLSSLLPSTFDRRFVRVPLHPVFLSGNSSDDGPLRCAPRPASIWHSILPSYWRKRRKSMVNRRDNYFLNRGEGSWNVACDTRPARWLNHPDLAWLLFGISDSVASEPMIDTNANLGSEVEELKTDASCNYRVTDVVADGRCLFRAIAHSASLKNGENVPDENRQRELADELRAQVVQELLKRREEMERFFDEDFDVYIERIQQPYVWGGEPELLMASHVLRTPISVFTKDRSSGILMKIGEYGEEYGKEDESCISVLFHGYGHYDILETA